MNKTIINQLKDISRKGYLALAVLVALASLLPILNYQRAQAATVTARSLSLSSNVNSGTATYTLQFDVTTGSIGSFEIAFCTTPLLGTVCTSPTGFALTSVAFAGTGGLKTGGSGGTNVTGFALGTTTNAPACGVTTTTGTVLSSNTIAASGNSACGIRIAHATAAQTFATAGGEVWMQFTVVTNPTTAGTFFTRVGTFGAIGYTTYQDGGTMANSVQALQNVSFKVQETLAFCVGSLSNGVFAYAGFAAAALGNNCSDTAGTNISLGIAPDSVTRCITPVSAHTASCNDTSTIEDERYGYAMIQTNASGGASIGYRPNSAGAYTQGTLQIASASGCVYTVDTDECINPVNEEAAAAIGAVAAFPSTSGSEAFGMAVPAKNNTGRGTNVLNRNTSSTGYGFTGEVTGGTACTTGAAAGQDCWNWHRTGSGTLASATGPIDNEALEILFATKSAITTPPGLYVVDVDYYSVPTY